MAHPSSGEPEPQGPSYQPGQHSQANAGGEGGGYRPSDQPGHGQPGAHGYPGGYGGYQPPGPPGYGGYGPPPQQGTNVMAILSLVFAFVFAPVGIVLGHVARKQIRETGEQGAPLATWGLILSYIFTALYVLGCCAWIAVAIWAGSDGNTGY